MKTNHPYQLTGTVKKTIAFLLVLLIGLVELVQPSLHSAIAKPDSDFAVAISSDPVTLDPAKAGDPSSLLVTSQIYETLVNFAPGGSQIQPGLAQNWSASSDGLTWTFNIRSGVKFQDGTDLNAAAVLFNFQRWWDPGNAYHTGSFPNFEYLIGLKNSGSLISSLSSNSTQFIIVLTDPAPLLTFLAMPAFAIASPTAIQGGNLGTHPMGSGPFQFGLWTTGSQVRLDLYPDYQGTAPNVTSVSFKVLPTSSAQLAALQSNSVQSAGDITGSDLTTAMADPNLAVRWRPSTTVGYLGINSDHTPFDKLLVRQAIAHAINKKSLISDIFLPGTQVPTQLLPSAIWGYDPSLRDYSYDPILAKNLLSQAGYPNGFTTTLTYRNIARSYTPDPTATANQIAADLTAVGITTTVQEYASGQFIDELENGNLGLYLIGWAGDYLHPYNYFAYLFCNPGNKQFGATMDMALCNYVNDGLVLPSAAQQLDAYQAASDRVFNTIPLVPLANPRTPLVTRSDIGGVIPSPSGNEMYQSTFTIQSRIYLPLTER